METNKNNNLMCIKQESILTKMINFIKNMFRRQKQEVENQKQIDYKKTKEDLLEIYKVAKNGNYNLNQLSIEEILILNNLLDTEIQVKTKKLDEIVTNINMNKYALKNKI